MNFKTLALATVAVVGMSGAASAATLSVVGGTPLAFGNGNYDADCTGGSNFCYNPSGPAGALTQALSTFFAAPAGLQVTGPTRIRVTFLGKEAGATNTAFSLAGGSVTNTAIIGSTFSSMVGGPGLLDFNFKSSLAGAAAGSAGFVGTAAIAFSAVFNGGNSVFAYFDDSGADNNRDWDDMVVRIDVVPVPAAGLLLLGGLGAIAALKRRRKAA